MSETERRNLEYADVKTLAGIQYQIAAMVPVIHDMASKYAPNHGDFSVFVGALMDAQQSLRASLKALDKVFLKR